MEGYIKRTPQGRVATRMRIASSDLKPPTGAQAELFANNSDGIEGVSVKPPRANLGV